MSRSSAREIEPIQAQVRLGRLTMGSESTHAARPGGRRTPLVLWSCATFAVAGIAALEVHAARSGRAATPPTRIDEHAARPRVFAFFHPLCPCSRACATELERVARAVESGVDIRAYVLRGGALPHPEAESELELRLRAVPGVVVEPDPDGQFARHFGVETSGSVLVYSADGELLFDGGITASRGHEGANSFAHAFEERIRTGRGTRVTTPVFGCALSARAGDGDLTP